jgi:hypothetical protein
MHTQSYLPPCSRIRPVGKRVRATISVRVGERYDLKYAAIWRVSASGEIISCTDGSHWSTWKLRMGLILDWTRKPKPKEERVAHPWEYQRILGPGVPQRVSTRRERELELAALAMQPLDASEYECSDDWSSVLKGHPIFSTPTDTRSSQQLELSTNSLPDFLRREPHNDSNSPSGRRQTMVLKDADLIVAVGKEIRVTSLGDAKLGRGKSKSYKVRVAVMSFRDDT